METTDKTRNEKTAPLGDAEVIALSRLLDLRHTDHESDRIDFLSDIVTDALLAMSSESRDLTEFRGKVRAALLNFEAECSDKEKSKLVASIIDVL